MATIPVKRRRTGQPSKYTPLNRADPRNRGVLVAYDLGTSLGDLTGKNNPAEEVSSAGFATSNSTIGGIAGRTFQHTDSAGEGSRIRIPNVSSVSVSGSWTFIATCRVVGIGEAGFGRMIDTGSAVGGEGFGVFSNGATTSVRGINFSDTTNFTDSGSDLVSGWNLVVVTYTNGGAIQIYINGKASGSPATPASAPLALTGSAGNPSIGNRSGSDLDRDFNGQLGFIAVYNRAWSATEVASLGTTATGVYQLLEPISNEYTTSDAVAGSNNTGTLAVTLDDATLAGIGGVTRSGTLATTLADATLASIGAVTRSGTLAVTLADATLAGQGTVAVGANISGSAAITLADATLAGIGAVTRSGTTSTTLADATLAGVGAVTRSGTLSVTLDNATLTGVGTITGETVPVSHGGGMSQASNVSGKKKPKKKAKAVESEEWLKAEATARALLQERFTKTTPQDKIEALTSHIESLQPVIAALQALATKEEAIEEPVQEEPSVHETRTEPKPEQPQPTVDRYDVLLSRIDDLEELIIIMMANQ